MKPLRLWKNLTIKYKLILSYSLILFLAVVLGSFVIHSLVGRTMESHLEKELSHTTANILNIVRTLVANSIKNHLRAVAEKNREVVKYYYQEYRAGRLNEAEAKAKAGKILLSQTIGQTGYIFVWDVRDAPGKIPLAVHPKVQGRDVASAGFARRAVAMKNGYLEYEWKNPGEEKAREKAMYLSYFQPWNWVIAASSYRAEFNTLIDLKDFREIILALHFGEEGYSFIMNGHGDMVVPPSRPGTIFDSGYVMGRKIVGEILRLKSGKIYYQGPDSREDDPGRRLVIFRYLPEYDWIVASSSYPGELYASLRMIRNIAAAVLVAAMLMLLPITLRLSSSIADPLHQLMSRFAAGARGDFSVRLEIDSESEVGLLSRYFNDFMEKLEAYRLSRIKAEEDLNKERERFRALAEQSPLGISLVHRDGDYEYINPAYVKIFGYTLNEVKNGREWFNRVFPDPGERINARQAWFDILDELQAGLTLVRSFEVACRNGEKKVVRFRVVMLPDGNYLVIYEDITDNVRMEEELRNTRNYLQNVIDSMPSFLVGVDSLCRVSWWNGEAQKITGLDGDQARGKPLSQVFPLLAGQIGLVKESIILKEPRRTNKFRTGSRGEIIYLDVMVYPLASDPVEGAVIRLDDVTLRVRMEEMMVQTEKMMSVGELAAGMAHEINNPLEVMIHGALNIGRRLSTDVQANRRAAEECGIQLEKVRSFLDRRQIFKLLEGITASGVKAARIVTNMLEFSRKSEADIEPTNLNELTSKALELALSQYSPKKQYDFSRINVIKDLDAALPPVWCEPVKIEQVILNLLRNAAQALADYNGRHQGWSPRIVLRTGLEGEMVFIRVEDNGPGMNEQVRRRVFEPFFTTKPAGRGTGLGLSVSYFIVTEDHRGILNVESEPDKGAKFIVGLPIKRNDPAPGFDSAEGWTGPGKTGG